MSSTTDHHHNHHHDGHAHHHQFEKKTSWVFILTVFTMVAEIGVGYYTHSMSLLAEGWHMGTHVFAIGLTWLAYFVSRKYAHSQLFSFNKEKLLALSGFTNAVVLQIIALMVFIESVDRLIHPGTILFNEAVIIAAIGLVVNILSVAILHHDHNHSDLNMRAAYLHIIADIFTSLAAILSLLAGIYFHIQWLDAASGVLGSLVITSWAFTLIKGAGRSLIEWKKNG